MNSYRHGIWIFLFCMAVSLYSGCADSEWTEPFPDRLSITVRDSIGIETGDSCYVLGSIVDAEVSPSGSIILLDQIACCIREFSPSGMYLSIFSRRGNGPGEFAFPQEMALHPDGRIIVRDMLKRSLTILTANGESLSDLAGWPLLPPSAIVSVDEDHIVGYETVIDLHGSEVLVIFKPALYSLNDTRQKLVFLSDSVVMNVEDISSSLTGLMGYSIMTSDGEGRIFYSRRSTGDYEVHCWDIDGNLLFSVSLEIPPVAKTPQELLEETEYARIQFSSLGLNTLPEGFEPDPFHTLIVGLGVDSRGNLWIQRGTEERPVFDIIDNDGVHIGTAEFPRAGRYWQFSISPNGSLAWNLDPLSGVQRVYMIDLPAVDQE